MIGWLAPRYGGPAILLPELCVALARRGHQVEIATTNADGDRCLPVQLGEPVVWEGATTRFHPLSRPRGYLTSWSLLANLRRRLPDFDIVHIHTLYRFHGLAAAAVSRAHGVPYVIQAHGSLDPWHRRQKRWAKTVYHALLEDRIIRGAAVMACTSERERVAIRGLDYTVPTWVIPAGVNAAQLRIPRAARAAGISLRADASVVAFLGRISAKKGVSLLVESFRATAAAWPRAHLVIAGPDDEGIGRGLRPLIANAGLSGRVSFLGPVTGERKVALLQRADVFVLPSADESFGVAVAEAMAVGCPVVVSPEVAIADVVRHSGAGLVVARDPEAVAEAIATILSDPGRRAAMGNAGRQAVDERFSWASVAANTETMYDAVLTSRRRRMKAPTLPTADATLTDLWDEGRFRCPRCRGVLMSSFAGGGWKCERCLLTGSVEQGIPILLAESALADNDELDHDHGHRHRTAQAVHFDRPDEELFEIQRPHGTPRLYRFLLAEKFRRAVRPIGPHLVGASALSVCGGSAMDAEFLARAGAHVTTSDLSLGAATRANARSKVRGLAIQSVVADVEHLPFADQSVDLVAVHDGLHHLEDPYVGLSEMARVARRWVVVSEPARASITRLAVRVGLALDTEPAGNRVARLEPRQVASFLAARGYVVLRADRYAMYYPHHPGAVFRFLSRPVIYPIVRVGWRIANALLGRFGNKMVVVAERAPSAADTAMGTP